MVSLGLTTIIYNVSFIKYDNMSKRYFPIHSIAFEFSPLADTYRVGHIEPYSTKQPKEPLLALPMDPFPDPIGHTIHELVPRP